MLIETDHFGRVELPGHHNERFLMRENDDGSLHLLPTRVVTEAQSEYEQDPGLQELLTRATSTPRRTSRAETAAPASPRDDYSAVADEQLGRLADSSDVELYRDVVDTCELAFATPWIAQASSSVVSTVDGIRYRLAVTGHPSHHVFWSATEDGLRIEAVFPQPDSSAA